jgi:urate oxidase
MGRRGGRAAALARHGRKAVSAARSYGKLSVPVQRVGVAPLRGLPASPESPLRALDTGLLACEVSIEVLGRGFLAAYTEGDNRRVVATDTMKNAILRRAHEDDGATLEGLVDALGHAFVGSYDEMEGVRLCAREMPFAPVAVGAGGERSDRRFRLGDGDRAVAHLELARGGGDVALVDQRSERVVLRPLKTTGSAFTSFAPDQDTTLPERRDRPLFVHLDVGWRYGDPADALAGDPARYVAPGQVPRRGPDRRPRVRQRVDPASRPRDRPPAASRCWPRSSCARRTTPSTRSPPWPRPATGRAPARRRSTPGDSSP